MFKKPAFFGIHAEPSKKLKWFLAILPFVLLVIGYIIASDYRHQINEADKLLPTISKMYETTINAATVPNKRTGEIQLWVDTASSLKRIGIALLISSVVGLSFGINLGMLPGIRALLLPFVIFISIIPPLAILPILFISFGVDELAKIILIFIGTAPFIIRDIYSYVAKIPKEQIIKAITLSNIRSNDPWYKHCKVQWDITYRVILRQTMPRLIETVRMQMGPAWLFLIASEAIAATSGLGYRIFLVRRYLAMDMIIPYVLWIVLIGLSIDLILQKVIKIRYPWFSTEK